MKVKEFKELTSMGRMIADLYAEYAEEYGDRMARSMVEAMINETFKIKEVKKCPVAVSNE
jgi:hypothetical protein